MGVWPRAAVGRPVGVGLAPVCEVAARGDAKCRECHRGLLELRVSVGNGDGDLARNAARLPGIPGILIRGALDFAPPIGLFWRLARDWPASDLVAIEDEGHLGGHATHAAVVRATDGFARMRLSAAADNRIYLQPRVIRRRRRVTAGSAVAAGST